MFLGHLHVKDEEHELKYELFNRNCDDFVIARGEVLSASLLLNEYTYLSLSIVFFNYGCHPEY
jgi:hypothetical protein